MPKNQKPPNAFMIFVMERKRELENQGEKFEGVTDAVAKLGSAWEHMSKEERQPYEERAKKRKEEAKQKAEKTAYEYFDTTVESGSGSGCRGIPG